MSQTASDISLTVDICLNHNQVTQKLQSLVTTTGRNIAVQYICSTSDSKVLMNENRYNLLHAATKSPQRSI